MIISKKSVIVLPGTKHSISPANIHMIKPIRYVEDQNLIEIRVDAKVILKLRSQDSIPGKPYELDLFVKKVDSDADDNSLVEVKNPKKNLESEVHFCHKLPHRLGPWFFIHK